MRNKEAFEKLLSECTLHDKCICKRACKECAFEAGARAAEEEMAERSCYDCLYKETEERCSACGSDYPLDEWQPKHFEAKQ